MLTTYAHTTFLTARNQLAARLGDASKIHWLDDELGRYIVNAIRLFNQLTGTHRDSAQFITVAGTSIYDITSVNTAFTLLRGYTIRDQELIKLVQYMLMEPVNAIAWTGSEMFTLDEVVRALERRRNQFLAETAAVTTQRSYLLGTVDILDLPDTVIAIRRAVWQDGLSGRYYHLQQSDEDTVTGVLSMWRQQIGVPNSFSMSNTPNMRMQFTGQFPNAGTLQLLTVETGAALDPTANTNVGTLLGVPDDLAMGICWGAIADLLYKDGPARDAERAALAESIFSLYVDNARHAPVILGVSINGVQQLPSALSVVDATAYGWQGQQRDQPSVIGISSSDVIATKPVPDGGYAVTISCVRNAIVPVTDGDFIQVSRDDLGGVLAWAEMLATFKSQGASFENARKSAQLLFERASAYSVRRGLQSPHLGVILGQSTEDRRWAPIYKSSESGRGIQHDSADEAKDNASTSQSRARSNSASAMHRRRLGGR